MTIETITLAAGQNFWTVEFIFRLAVYFVGGFVIGFVAMRLMRRGR